MTFQLSLLLLLQLLHCRYNSCFFITYACLECFTLYFNMMMMIMMPVKKSREEKNERFKLIIIFIHFFNSISIFSTSFSSDFIYLYTLLYHSFLHSLFQLPFLPFVNVRFTRLEKIINCFIFLCSLFLLHFAFLFIAILLCEMPWVFFSYSNLISRWNIFFYY